jgi:hypothetical protein
MRCLPLFMLAAAAVAGPASAASFGVSDFDRIRIDGPFKVTLKTGVAPFASATGSPAATDRVSIDVEGRTLVVHSNASSWGGYPGKDPGPVEIAIGTHDLMQAWLNGSGSLTIDKVSGLAFALSVQGAGSVTIAKADIDQLQVGVSGGGSATLGGRAGKLKTILRGDSQLDGSELATKDADIAADGPSTVSLRVTNAASVQAAGVSSITLTGDPACTARLSGSASLTGCRTVQ